VWYVEFGVSDVQCNVITFLFVYLLFYLQGNDKSVQKKSFRILEEISVANVAECQKVITSQQSKLKKLFLESVVTSNASSTAVNELFFHMFLL